MAWKRAGEIWGSKEIWVIDTDFLCFSKYWLANSSLDHCNYIFGIFWATHASCKLKAFQCIPLYYHCGRPWLRLGKRNESLKAILIENSAVRKDRDGSNSPDHLQMCFFLRPGYPEKNPLSLKMEFIQVIFGLLLIIMSRERIPGLPTRWQCERQSLVKAGAIIVCDIRWPCEGMGGSECQGWRLGSKSVSPKVFSLFN